MKTRDGLITNTTQLKKDIAKHPNGLPGFCIDSGLSIHTLNRILSGYVPGKTVRVAISKLLNNPESCYFHSHVDVA